jgi:hypothetical protein
MLDSLEQNALESDIKHDLNLIMQSYMQTI